MGIKIWKVKLYDDETYWDQLLLEAKSLLEIQAKVNIYIEENYPEFEDILEIRDIEFIGETI